MRGGKGKKNKLTDFLQLKENKEPMKLTETMLQMLLQFTYSTTKFSTYAFLSLNFPL
jgi:hypothetical protein